MSVHAVYTDPPTSHAQGHIIREGYSMLTETLREPIHELSCEASITPDFFVLFDVFPFSAGAQRLAFKGSIFERTKPEPSFRVHVVIKLEMAHPDTVGRPTAQRTAMGATEAKHTVRKHDLSAKFVEKWCTLGINKSVYVLSTEQVRITRGCSLGDIDSSRYPVLHHLFKKLSLDAVLYASAVGTVEDYLPGRFTKFLNNDGNTNHSVTANLPAAFAHWSWVESGGQVMISDIQGVRTAAGYILTDPCVHSVHDADGFGMSDLGMVGVEEFFDKHVCNELCNDLGLGKDGMDLDLGHALRTRVVSKKAKAAGGGAGAEGGGLQSERDERDDDEEEEEEVVAVVEDDDDEAKWQGKRKAKGTERRQKTGMGRRNGRVAVQASTRGEAGKRGVARRRALEEESQGKVQRRATIRLVDAAGGEGGDDEMEMDLGRRRKTFAVAEDFREQKKRGRGYRHGARGKRDERGKMFLSGFQSLFRFRKKEAS